MKLGVTALSNRRVLAIALASLLSGLLLVASMTASVPLLTAALATEGHDDDDDDDDEDDEDEQTTVDWCGQTITTDIELTNDLTCPGNGLIVGANGVAIDLNGHTIAGPGWALPFVGIAVNGRSDVRIEGGIITQFRTGIMIASSNHVVVKEVAVVRNGHPAFPSGDGIRVMTSTDVRIKHTLIAGNGNDGVEIQGSTGVSVSHSVIQGSASGVAFRGAPSTDSTVRKNWIGENGCGIRGPTQGVILSKNIFLRNGTNVCA